jgi:hypothetical protein
MQKTTLFTVLITFFVTLVVADFLIKRPFDSDDELNAALAEATVLHQSAPQVDPSGGTPARSGDTLRVSDLPDPSFNAASSPLAPSSDDISAFSPLPEASSPSLDHSSVSDFLEKTGFVIESVKGEDLQKIGFRSMKLTKIPFDDMIFQLLDVSPVKNLAASRMAMTDGKNTFGILTEFEFVDEPRALTFYADLKQKVGAFSPRVTPNETNQYGQNSFFMNDSSRPSTAFLTFRLRNHIFCFSYPKVSHEFYKSLTLLLAK